MSLHGPVLAAIDLGEGANAPLEEAHALASSLHAAMTVCHVLPEAIRTRVLFPQEAAAADPALHAELEQRARAAVATRLEAVAGRGATGAGVVVDSGSPHGVILAQADEIGAGLIVLGPGRVAWRVARDAPCPVLIARPSPAGGGVLGATDFSDPALPAVEAAIAESARRRAPLRLVHCLDVDLQAMAAMPGMTAPPLMPAGAYQALEARATSHLQESLQQFGATGECVVWRGPAGPGIVAAAASPPAALVVVGTRGRTGLKRLVLGSVAEEVMREALCSVLVVPLSRGTAAG
jgi:nucleotide-binding universal stress UspA family protein